VPAWRESGGRTNADKGKKRHEGNAECARPVACDGSGHHRLAWGDVLWALCLISDEAKLTMTLGITRLIGQFRVLWSQTMAATVIATVIPAVLYLLLQRYLVHGVADAAVRE
jgi:hypothetical protein